MSNEAETKNLLELIDSALSASSEQRRKLMELRERVKAALPPCPHPKESWQYWVDPGSGRKSPSCGLCGQEL